MKVYNHKASQRGASLVETTLSMVLVALVTFTAIHRYGATLSALFGQNLVRALGGKQVGVTAGVSKGDPPVTSNSPIISVAKPLPIGGGSSQVGGVPNVQSSKPR